MASHGRLMGLDTRACLCAGALQPGERTGAEGNFSLTAIGTLMVLSRGLQLDLSGLVGRLCRTDSAWRARRHDGGLLPATDGRRSHRPGELRAGMEPVGRRDIVALPG